VTLATYQLQGELDYWWNLVKTYHNNDQLYNALKIHQNNNPMPQQPYQQQTNHYEEQPQQQ
jgi:hypothetical protein